MAKRFTETTKWEDCNFRNMTIHEKLLFLYIVDHCDIAGFWEIDLPLAAFKIGCCVEEAEVALKGLNGRVVEDGKTLWVKNFLKHQRNDNINLSNKVHLSVVRSIARHKSFTKCVLEHIGKPDLAKIINEYR